MARRRHYSEETPKAEKEESKDGTKPDDGVLTQEKLRAKEAEVIDLTVCVTREETEIVLTQH